MAISFNSIPGNVRVPFVYVEIDSSRAGAPGGEFKSLLIGQRLSTGTQAAESPVTIGDAADAVRLFGRGSMLALMAERFRRQNPIGELWGIALDDAAGATQATTTVTVTSAATGAGTIALYIAGRRVAVPISGATTANAVAAAIAAAITADGDLPVTAAAAAAVVTITARNGGLASDIDVQANYQPDDAFPAGVALTIAGGTAGATDPDIQGALDVMGDEQYNVVVSAYSDTTSIAALETELAERWGPTQQIDGVGIASYHGAGRTVAQATTYGNARNSRHVSVADHGFIPNPMWEVAAAYGGQVASSGAADPARPFQTLPLLGILAPPVENRRTFSERNTLLSDGMATLRPDQGGVVRIERAITTYQTNAAGAADLAFLDLNTPMTLSFLRSNFRNRIAIKFPRYKLADAGALVPPGQPIITPTTGRAEAVAWFREMEQLGLVEGGDQFKADLVCERNVTDRNRLDWLLPPNLVNQFRVGGVQIAFLL